MSIPEGPLLSSKTCCRSRDSSPYYPNTTTLLPYLNYEMVRFDFHSVSPEKEVYNFKFEFISQMQRWNHSHLIFPWNIFRTSSSEEPKFAAFLANIISNFVNLHVVSHCFTNKYFNWYIFLDSTLQKSWMKLNAENILSSLWISRNYKCLNSSHYFSFKGIFRVQSQCCCSTTTFTIASSASITTKSYLFLKSFKEINSTRTFTVLFLKNLGW